MQTFRKNNFPLGENLDEKLLLSPIVTLAGFCGERRTPSNTKFVAINMEN